MPSLCNTCDTWFSPLVSSIKDCYKCTSKKAAKLTAPEKLEQVLRVLRSYYVLDKPEPGTQNEFGEVSP
jgi:hypothetical protein